TGEPGLQCLQTTRSEEIFIEVGSERRNIQANAFTCQDSRPFSASVAPSNQLHATHAPMRGKLYQRRGKTKEGGSDGRARREGRFSGLFVRNLGERCPLRYSLRDRNIGGVDGHLFWVY